MTIVSVVIVWAIAFAGVFALLWRVCKVSERLRPDSRVCDMQQRQREAEGAQDVFEERAA